MALALELSAYHGGRLHVAPGAPHLERWPRLLMSRKQMLLVCHTSTLVMMVYRMVTSQTTWLTHNSRVATQR
jgi:hypothetical protein